MSHGVVTEHELRSQPTAWRRLGERLAEPGALPEINLAHFDEVLYFGSGSSYYLAEAACAYLEARAGVAGRAVPSCELMMFPAQYLSRPARRLAVGISRSGESTEAVVASEALEARGVPWMAVSCAPERAWPRSAPHLLAVPEGREDGLVMLRSFTCMLLASQVLIAQQVGQPGPDLARLADDGEALLSDWWGEIAAFVRDAKPKHQVVLGSGPTYAIAREAGLKMQEMAITACESYHALEYRHGPKSTAGPETLVTLLASGDPSGLEVDLLRDLKGQGVRTLVVGPGVDAFDGVADLRIELGSSGSARDRLPLYLLPCQVLAFETATMRGRDPDAPPNLSQVVRLGA